MMIAAVHYCDEIEAAAEAMFVASSTNHDPKRDWKELRNFPPAATTVSHYLKLAAAALLAIDDVRRK